MIHGVKKIKIKGGQDSNSMIMRKLMYNFVKFAHVTTTEARAKALKSTLDKVLGKTKEKTESNKNYLLGYFQQKKVVDTLFEQVGPVISKIIGGYVKLVRKNLRINDGSMMVDVRWAHPVVIEWKDEMKVEPKKVTKAASKKEKKVEAPIEEK